MGAVRMLHTLRQTLAREPDARGRGVHRRHDLEELSLTATRPQGWQVDGDHLGTATGLRVRARAGRAPRRGLSFPALTHVPRGCQRPAPGVWFRRVAGLARPW